MSKDTVDALQLALAAEHAVVWGYGLVGGQIGSELLPTVQEADATHRARRDATAAIVRDQGGEPVTAQPSYDVPFAVKDTTTALRLAVHLEEGAAEAWHFLLSATGDAGLRQTAVTALSDSAVRATRWRARLTPATAAVSFPGVKK